MQQVADSKKTDNSVCNTGVQTIELQSISVTAELTCTVTIKKPAGRVARPMDRVTKRRGACANRSTGADGETATGASASGRRWRRWRGSEYMIEGERAGEGDRDRCCFCWPPAYHVVVGDHCTLLRSRSRSPNNNHAKLATKMLEKLPGLLFILGNCAWSRQGKYGKLLVLIQS